MSATSSTVAPPGPKPVDVFIDDHVDLAGAFGQRRARLRQLRGRGAGAEREAGDSTDANRRPAEA